MDFDGAKKYILNRLSDELKPTLYYHSVGHTKSVLESTVRLAGMENITGNELHLLETASLFHDSGMLIQYTDHENASIHLAQEILPSFDYTAAEIDFIGRLISMTKLPQRAQTLLEEIICDADLDYLGREDFFIHSFELQLEWKCYGVKDTSFLEWMKIQEQFLSSHHYFTKSATQLRESQKMINLMVVSDILKKINHL